MTERYIPTWARKSIQEMAESIAAPVYDYDQRQSVTRAATLYLEEVRQQSRDELTSALVVIDRLAKGWRYVGTTWVRYKQTDLVGESRAMTEAERSVYLEATKP